MPIIRTNNCIYATFGICHSVWMTVWYCIPDSHLHRATDAKCRTDTVISPDDRHIVARNIHSFSSLSYDRSKASSKASSLHRAIQSFLFQMRVSCPFLKSSNSFVRLLRCLPVTSIPPCIFPSITRCRRQFIRKMRPIQFAFRLRIS